ncbi:MULTISPECIES: hypothetical protein [Janthinobacterium]|uniref:Uncharacterized protein n=1 Tax=Janthinobacterium kumbetense TaxID=2950280 RepID=A0ABT0WXA3_9BURK|nr:MULTISPECIES: hypothetical protein [Janthinobacterium]MCM2568349.1 hypothetical protein [Janthinobacterium kumbetense]MDN2714783.1 hypothetical protein [Janthinobacterium sp. SUN120]
MKNPWMSMYLSAANRIANTARGHATAAVKREAAKNTGVTQVWFDSFLPPTGKPRRSRKAK